MGNDICNDESNSWVCNYDNGDCCLKYHKQENITMGVVTNVTWDFSKVNFDLCSNCTCHAYAMPSIVSEEEEEDGDGKEHTMNTSKEL